jgi:hypothetical protein
MQADLLVLRQLGFIAYLSVLLQYVEELAQDTHCHTLGTIGFARHKGNTYDVQKFASRCLKLFARDNHKLITLLIILPGIQDYQAAGIAHCYRESVGGGSSTIPAHGGRPSLHHQHHALAEPKDAPPGA